MCADLAAVLSSQYITANISPIAFYPPSYFIVLIVIRITMITNSAQFTALESTRLPDRGRKLNDLLLDAEHDRQIQLRSEFSEMELKAQ